MTISIVDVVIFKYPGEFEAGNVSFYENNEVPGNIAIGKWNVVDVPKPSVEELISLFPVYEKQFILSNLQNSASKILQNLLDATAKSRQYTDSWALVGYKDSTVLTWSEEARAFISWRDSVYQYAINIFDEIKAGTIPIPSLQEFEESIPPMVWPN